MSRGKTSFTTRGGNDLALWANMEEVKRERMHERVGRVLRRRGGRSVSLDKRALSP